MQASKQCLEFHCNFHGEFLNFKAMQIGGNKDSLQAGLNVSTERRRN